MVIILATERLGKGWLMGRELRTCGSLCVFLRAIKCRISCSFSCACALALVLAGAVASPAEEPENYAGEIVVTPSRIPGSLLQEGRSVAVITREEIENAPVRSVADVLKWVVGMDVRERGPGGVQSDLSVRGTTFEQVLILVDGVRVSDPQTGHHNMDLPLDVHDIERIEVMRGHGSALYGANAFGGTINIITRKPEAKRAEVKLAGGENGLGQGSAYASLPAGRSTHAASFTKSISDGFRADTDFDISNVFYKTVVERESGPVNLTAGHTHKKFGADSFYAATFPNEWERTETSFVSLGSQFGAGGAMLKPSLYFRRHDDLFILDRSRPGFYANDHRTDVFGGELESTFDTRVGDFVLGGDLGRDEIDSTNLGDHARRRGALFFEFEPRLEGKLAVNVASRADYYSDWDWENSPGVSARYELADALRARASVGHSFRVPSFTELYYADPANKGNPELEPEKAWSYEAGLEGGPGALTWEWNVFRREARDLIDWVRLTSSEPWQAVNIAEVNTNGTEATLRFYPQKAGHPSSPVTLLGVGYALLDADKEAMGFESKYALDYLRHQATFEMDNRLPLGLLHTCRLAYRDRIQGEDYFLLDARLSRKFRDESVEAFVEGTNILNTSYTEVAQVPQPGRWLSAGIIVRF